MLQQAIARQSAISPLYLRYVLLSGKKIACRAASKSALGYSGKNAAEDQNVYMSLYKVSWDLVERFGYSNYQFKATPIML